MKIVTGILIVAIAVLSFKHGIDGLKGTDVRLLSWGINRSFQVVFSMLNMVIAGLILFPQTFFAGNCAAAILFIVLMAFQLSAGDFRAALIEIPFLSVTLLLIYLGHPLK